MTAATPYPDDFRWFEIVEPGETRTVRQGERVIGRHGSVVHVDFGGKAVLESGATGTGFYASHTWALNGSHFVAHHGANVYRHPGATVEDTGRANVVDVSD